ncbi:putative reverse transcriptase domain-containing protein [Tanacetum coccineum]
MVPNVPLRSTPVHNIPSPNSATHPTSVTIAPLQAMIDQGVTAALAVRDANRNGDDSHTLGTGGRRTKRVARRASMFPEESDKRLKGSVGGFPNMIMENIKASKREPMQEVVEFIGHWWGNANMLQSELAFGSCQKPTCFECGVQGRFKRECPKLKNNKNRGNQVGNDRDPAKVYAMRHVGTNPDSNVVTGTFLLNNRYASILFDTGADRSFVSTAFSSQIDITPTALDHYYDVELADGRIIGLNTILRGCTLNILNHPFNIDLMPVELGSFDAIIGMDWLAKYQAIIVCAEKIVRIPWGNETLIVHGDGSNRGHEARLHIISYSKTQEYMLKGCPVFLAHVTTKEVEDKSEKKRLEDVPIVQDFPEVFPEDLSGLPPTRQVEFQIDLVPGVAPVGTTERAVRQRLYKIQFLTLGSPDPICQEKRWIIPDVH